MNVPDRIDELFSDVATSRVTTKDAMHTLAREIVEEAVRVCQQYPLPHAPNNALADSIVRAIREAIKL